MALIQYLTQIQFDFGAIRLLRSECERIGITRPLVVTDAGVRAAGILQKALDALGDLPVAVFDQTPSNPTEAAVRAAAAMYREGRCDGLIAVGGGSAIEIEGAPNISGLKQVDPERYESLEHPGDQWSYDIFSQAAQVLRQPGEVNILGELVPQHVIAFGESQSAARLVTYVDAIHPVASDCSRASPSGRCERSIGPMLSRPRKPPSNRLDPSASWRLTHHVKLTRSFANTRSRKSTSRAPSIANTSSAAHACTGGFTSEKSHSYAGIAPLGCWNHSRHTSTSWYFANAGSRWAQTTAWNPLSHAANHGYSHGSGIASTSKESRCRHPVFRPLRWSAKR